MASVLDLQQKVLKQLGIRTGGNTIQASSHHTSRVQHRRTTALTRGELRKAERAQKRRFRERVPRLQKQPNNLSLNESRGKGKRAGHGERDGEFESDSYGSTCQVGESMEMTDVDPATESDPDCDTEPEKKPSQLVPKQLSREDAEIETLEKKLGLKIGKHASHSNHQDQDGLNGLLGGTETHDADEDGKKGGDDSMEYHQWLAEKRNYSKHLPSRADLRDRGDDDDGVSDVEFSVESFAGFSSDDEESGPRKSEQLSRRRENPYVAPVDAYSEIYVAPSRRAEATILHTNFQEASDRLQKLVQGQINRLTDANILSIVETVEELYQKNPRGEVTGTLIEVIMAQVCKPEALADPFFVLAAGFTSAIYKILGPSFGSCVLRRVCANFEEEYDKVRLRGDADGGWQKQTSNLISFLAQLYVFDVVSPRLIYDYIHFLLRDLTELNVELLLRLIRMAGRMLRRDDPVSLKDTVSAMNQSVHRTGPANLSARTKYMVEAINDLKTPKMKSKGSVDSAVVSEHVLRMKKKLGELKSESSRKRRLDGTIPMGIGLRDLHAAATEREWSLVGASVSAKGDSIDRRSDRQGRQDEYSEDDEDMSVILPDYPKRAREQGFTTSTQISVFIAVMSAMDAEHGYRQLLNLGLKASERREMGRVLIQCVGSEPTYNQYYYHVARQACTNKQVRFAFQDRLWQLFRRLGEPIFGDDDDDGDEDSLGDRSLTNARRLSHVGQMFGSLIADSSLPITVLKPINLTSLGESSVILVRSIIDAVLRDCSRLPRAQRYPTLERIFAVTKEHPTLVTGLYFNIRRGRARPEAAETAETSKAVAVRKEALRLLRREETVVV